MFVQCWVKNARRSPLHDHNLPLAYTPGLLVKLCIDGKVLDLAMRN